MKIILILINILFITVIACQDIEARKPLNEKSSIFLKDSALRNKKRVDLENILINKARDLDKQNTYKSSTLGFLYSIKNQKKGPLAKKGDFVEVQYQIEDLNKNILYSKDELQNIRFIIDKEDVLPALRVGVKLLSEGETGIFLFPSHFCYSYQGDMEKISPNQPLRFLIKLVSLTKN